MIKTKSSLDAILLKAIIFDVVLMAFLGIAQLWGVGIDHETFIKTIITLVILAVLMGLVLALKSDILDDQKKESVSGDD